jgi:hypothetical protein
MEQGIEEVLIRHRKTRRGVRTTEKSIPVLITVKDKLGQNSQSKKGGVSDPELADGSQAIIPTTDNATLCQCDDEHVYDHHDVDMERDQPQTKVRLSWYP